MMRKASMMLDHFMHHTINKIGGKAKAMVVTDSRRAAADYKKIIDHLIATEHDGKIKTLVAFSGEVEDSHGRKCTEANMNDEGVHDDGIRIKFQDDDYKILIVAEKFQTGFDQKLLHTMYVDKVLGGIQCIQTLSRLNRCCPGKEDTMVIDFRNDAEKVQKAFQQYYTETTLEGEVDTQRLYTLKNDVDNWKIISQDDVDFVVKSLLSHNTASAVPSYIRNIVDERVLPLDDDQKDLFRKLVNRYVRQYGFLAQLMDYTDPELEKFYVFCKVFYKYLPYTKETLPTEILELIDLDKLRIQMSFEGQLTLEDEAQTIKSSRIGEPGVKREDEKRTIAEILDIANSPYAGFLNENDKILKQILDAILEDPEVVDAFNAGNTYDALLTLVREKFDQKIAEQVEKYYNFAEVLEKDQALSLTLIRKFVEVIATHATQNSTLQYDEEVLKDAMLSAFESEFQDVCANTRSCSEYVDALFYVLNRASLPTLDGVDDIIKTALNNIYCNDTLSLVYKRMFYNQLVTKYEAYLKKLYYLITDNEITSRSPDVDARLSDAFHAFPCLWNLRYGQDSVSQRFSSYLDMLRDWRNNESHMAPDAEEQEVDAAIKNCRRLVSFCDRT